LVVVIFILTILIVFVALQAFTVLHEFKQAVRRFNQILDQESPPSKVKKLESHPVVHRFFRRSHS
jgi:cell division protein FtsL